MSVGPFSFARDSALWLLLALPFVAALGWTLGIRRRRVTRLTLWLRIAALAMLMLALAQPLLSTSASGRATIFVVDRSLSVSDANTQQINAWIESALESAHGDDRVSVVVFGASAKVAGNLGNPSNLGSEWQGADLVDTSFTDLESAIALARALPVGSARRIVLVSDGSENLGEALNQISQAAAEGTPIDVLPLDGVSANDLRVAGATAPKAVWNGSPVSVMASIASGEEGTATVKLIVDGVEKLSTDEQLTAGLNTFHYSIPDLTDGFHAIQVTVQSGTLEDPYGENDSTPLSVIVRSQPKVLLIASEGTDTSRLTTAWQSKGAEITQTVPKELSSRPSDLATFDAFVLDDVPANELSFDQQTGLRDAARSGGKGLIVIGGRFSYGPGQYAGTVLEDALPVTVKVVDGSARQRVALLLIIDKSGSMSYDPLGGTTKIDMAKEAAKLAVDALSDGDTIGIMTFNDTQQWVVKLVTLDGADTRDQVAAQIDGINSEGGTEILPALSLGFDSIRNVAVDVRHIVLISDGKSQSGTTEGYDHLIDDAIADRTTLSTIAIGDDADTDLLQHIADRGNGRYHFTESADEIPQLTLQEAEAAKSNSIITGSIQPIQLIPSPIMDGLDPEAMPPLDAYDFAQTKPDAQTVLSNSRQDPLLSKWQLGLGRVVAWTGDDGADFAREWTSWTDFNTFWTNVLNWALPDPENRAIAVSVDRDGQDAVVNVDSTGADGDYVNLDNASASVTTQLGQTSDPIPLTESGPGEYEFRVAAPEAGAYAITISDPTLTPALNEQTTFEIPQSPELLPDPNALALLGAIAARTGGRTLSFDDPGAVFSGHASNQSLPDSFRPVWSWALAAALVIFLIELANRYNALGRVRTLRYALSSRR